MQRSYINSDCLRWMLLGSLLIFAAFFSPVAAQRIWAQSPAGVTVRSVAVGGGVTHPEIEVKTSAPVTPATQAVTGPDRIVIDFPGALPAATLHALGVHHGNLKGIRTGLFQAQPPITRVVLDVDGPTDYQVSAVGNSIVIKLGANKLEHSAEGSVAAGRAASPSRPASAAATSSVATSLARAGAIGPVVSPVMDQAGAAASLRPASLPGGSVATLLSSATVTAGPATVMPGTATGDAVGVPVAPPKPRVEVAVRANLLSIHAEGATLAEVLYEVHRKTGADIAIPSGAERERVVVRLGFAPGKEVISTLLNGSRFNYILVGSEKDPGGFSNLLLSLKSGNGNSGMFARAEQPGAQFGTQAGGQQPPAIIVAPDPGVEQPIAEQAEPELETVPDEPAEAEAAAPVTGGPQPQPGAAPPQFPVQPIGDGVRQ